MNTAQISAYVANAAGATASEYCVLVSHASYVAVDSGLHLRTK